jgi:signal transduction histidine kinase
LSRRAVDVGWAAFAAANLAAMVLWERWETIPFHFIWVSLTLVYGLRIWQSLATAAVLCAVAVSTGTLILADVAHGTQELSELTEVPLMTAMFLAMVWHAQRRQQALAAVQELAEDRASLLDRQERFLQDASHELRTPVTIARGHLELLRAPEVAVALDELDRIESIVDRLLLLAKADGPDFVVLSEIDVEPFVEDVFLRWAELAPRSWQLGQVDGGTLRADAEAVRTALDALLENAVAYSGAGSEIELSACAFDGHLVLRVRDEGAGVPADAYERIFERFSRADAARTRAHGGVGLGLAIVDAIAKAHGGSCTVASSPAGSTFSLLLPDYRCSRSATAWPAQLTSQSTTTVPM